MNKERVIKYLELLNEFQEARNKNENREFTESEKALISEGNDFLKTNPELQRLVKLSLEERKKYVAEYFEEQAKMNGESEEVKAIKETFGFDVEDIENKKLQNGVEIFKFYAPKLQRVVVLENRKDKTLVEQLKQKQANDEKFQTSNDVQNTNEMLDEERQKDNVELKMIYINEIDNYKNTMDEMKPEDLKKLNYLITNADKLGIKKINLQNQIYLDEDDNIREVTYDKEKDQIEDQAPNALDNNVEQVNVSDRLDENTLANDYEDKPTEKEDIENYEELPLEIQNQVVTYHDYPELLNSMDEEERKKWEHYIELYTEHEKKKYVAPEMPKQKIYTPNKRGNGVVDIFLLSVITLITAAAVFLIAYQLYK